MVHIDEADPEAVAVDDLGSDAELDEDAVPMRKVIINNKVSPASLLMKDEREVGRWMEPSRGMHSVNMDEGDAQDMGIQC